MTEQMEAVDHGSTDPVTPAVRAAIYRVKSAHLAAELAEAHLGSLQESLSSAVRVRDECREAFRVAQRQLDDELFPYRRKIA